MNSSQSAHCSTCKTQCLCVSKKQVSRLVVASMILGFIVFVCGYYLGKRNAAQELIFEMQQELLVPSQHSLISSLHDATARLTSDKELTNINDQDGSTWQAENDAPIPTISTERSEASKVWQAQLAGWGTYKEAVRCVQLLKKAGMETRIVQRKSMSPHKDKVRYWYQVVSGTFSDKTELERLVNIVSQRVKIVGAKIVEVHNGGNERKTA